MWFCMQLCPPSLEYGMHEGQVDPPAPVFLRHRLNRAGFPCHPRLVRERPRVMSTRHMHMFVCAVRSMRRFPCAKLTHVSSCRCDWGTVNHWMGRRKTIVRTQESTGGGPINHCLGLSKQMIWDPGTNDDTVCPTDLRPTRTPLKHRVGRQPPARPSPPLPDPPARSALAAGTPARLFPPTRPRSRHTVPQQLPEPHGSPDPTDSAA